jgi:hypothetical protein
VKSKTYYIVGTFPKNPIENSQKEKKNRYHQQANYDHSLFWLDTATSIKSGGVKLVLWAQISPRSEMMWACEEDGNPHIITGQQHMTYILQGVDNTCIEMEPK